MVVNNCFEELKGRVGLIEESVGVYSKGGEKEECKSEGEQ